MTMCTVYIILTKFQNNKYYSVDQAIEDVAKNIYNINITTL